MPKVARLARQFLPWLAFAGALLLALWAGQSKAPALWTNAPGWSRARLVTTIAAEPGRPQAAPLAVDDQGGLYLFTMAAEGGVTRPELIALRRDATIAWRHSFASPVVSPQQLQLVWDGSLLHLFWLSEGQLYTAKIGQAGDAPQEPRLISGAATVESYAVAGVDGALHLWYAGPQATPGIYAMPAGDLAGPAQLIDGAGTRPLLRVDQAGLLHAAWLVWPQAEQPAIWYGAYAADGTPSGLPLRLAELQVASADDAIEGLVFGVDQAAGYLLWTVRVMTGRNAGAFYTQYLSFPLSAPQQATPPAPLSVPNGAALSYRPLAGQSLQAGPWVAIDSRGAASSTPPTSCSVNQSAAPNLALACQAQVQHRYNQQISQVSTLLFQTGQPTGYQLISFGLSGAYAPTLVSDQSQQLYLTWVSLQDSGFAIYLASSAPDMIAALGALTLDDLARISFEVIFGMLIGMIFTPFTALLWSVVPLVLLAITGPLRGDRPELSYWATLLSLGLAIAAYWAGKWRLLGQAQTYVPFSAWIPDIPDWLGLPLRVGVPALVTGLALWLAWRYTYRRQTAGALTFMLIYIGVDALLTMALYGGILVGAFYPQG